MSLSKSVTHSNFLLQFVKPGLCLTPPSSGKLGHSIRLLDTSGPRADPWVHPPPAMCPCPATRLAAKAIDPH
jgi:hypothetical protein